MQLFCLLIVGLGVLLCRPRRRLVALGETGLGDLAVVEGVFYRLHDGDLDSYGVVAGAEVGKDVIAMGDGAEIFAAVQAVGIKVA